MPYWFLCWRKLPHRDGAPAIAPCFQLACQLHPGGIRLPAHFRQSLTGDDARSDVKKSDFELSGERNSRTGRLLPVLSNLRVEPASHTTASHVACARASRLPLLRSPHPSRLSRRLRCRAHHLLNRRGRTAGCLSALRRAEIRGRGLVKSPAFNSGTWISPSRGPR
jgi:hypothetical protein